MRTALILAFVANLLLAAVSVLLLPESVAIHFGPGGVPDRWASSHLHALLMAGMNTFIFVFFLFSARLIRMVPVKYINLPNKRYWMRDENWHRAEIIWSNEMHLFGTAMLVFMFIAGLLALQANLSNPVLFREDLFWWPFGLFMAFTVYWVIRLVTRFRRPEKALR